MADELRFNLVLDDHAKATLDRVKGGLDEAEKKSRSLGDSMLSWVRDFSTHWGAIAFDRALHSIKELGNEVYEASSAELANRKALAGVLAISDDTGASFDELKNRAAGLSEEFANVAIETGQSKEAMVDAFSDMEARTGKPIAKVKELAMEMAQAGRAVPGGIGALTQGFNMFEMGVVRARNPLVMLIKASGMATGNAKQIASALQKMGSEKATELAEAAIVRMADKMKKVPPGIGEVVGSLKQMRENLEETIGIPVLQAIAPHFRRFGEYLRGHREDIEKWAKHAADVLGRGVEKAAELFKEGMQFLEAHADEIEKALKSGWDHAKEVAEFIISHKEEFMMAAGAYAGAKFGGGLAQGLGGAAGIGPAGVAALTIGSAIIGTATVEVMRMLAERDEVQSGQRAELDEQAKLGNVQGLRNMMDAMEETGNAAELFGDHWKGVREQLLATAEANAAIAEMRAKEVEDFHGTVYKMAGEFGVARDSMDDFSRQLQLGVAQLPMVVSDQAIDDLVFRYNLAMIRHDEAAAKFTAQMLVSAGVTAKSLEDAGLTLEGGLDAFSKHFEGGVAALMNRLKSFMGPDAKEAKAPKMTFDARGSTFNIKQDFRDQDPDRIATIFKQDVIRSVEQRRGSRLTSVLGF